MRLRNTRLSRLLRFGKNRSGNAVLIFALCLVPMVLAAGGAVDFTRYFNAQQTVQTALDAAVLAGAASDDDPATVDSSAKETWQSVATETLSSWNIAIDGTLEAPDIPPKVPTSDGTTYAGSVTAHLKMYFTPLIGINWLDFTVTSKAEREVTSSSTDGNVCIYLYGKDRTYSWGTYGVTVLNVNGGTLAAPECVIYGKTTDKSSLTIDSTVNASKVCIEGSYSPNKKPDNFTSPCDTSYDDPYAGNMPEITSSTCTDNVAVSIPNNPGTYDLPEGNHCSQLTFNGGNLTLHPGIYSGGINFNNSPTVTFEPGVYIILGGNWNLDGGTYSGTGVTFYFADSSYLQFNNSATASLSAPSSGDYNGILMYESASNSASSFTINMGGTLNGLIYLPSRDVTYNSSSAVTVNGALYYNSLISSTNLTVNYSGSSTGAGTYSPPRLIK